MIAGWAVGWDVNRMWWGWKRWGSFEMLSLGPLFFTRIHQDVDTK